MIFVRMHRHPGEMILAACDEEILGETFRGGGAKITVSRTFYGGDLVSEDVFIERTKSASIMNLVGNAVVNRAIAAGLVSEESVIVIGGVKHAQVVMM
ncbi:MAG: DUF424 family protein [Candidatus Methanomethylophilaceae archaeon]|nr:DUF424 family protein [Candidatus Methanomethylophilaceae archaeon]